METLQVVTMHGEGSTIIALMADGPRQVAVMREGSHEEAREIVRSVNCHDELVAALEGLLPMWESGIREPWVEAARAALAKARGEA